MKESFPSERGPSCGRRFVIGVLLVVSVLAAAVLLWRLVGRVPVRPWGNPEGATLSPEVRDDTQVGQWFEAPYPGLYRIEVTLDPSSVQSAHLILFQLKTDPTDTDALWTAEFSTVDVQAGVAQGFEFPPIRDSMGKTYYFALASPDSLPGDAIAVGYSPENVLDGARASLNGQPAMGNLQFRTYYSLRTRDRLSLLLGLVAQRRTYFLGNRWFYAGLAAAYLLVLGTFVWRVGQAVLEEEEL